MEYINNGWDTDRFFKSVKNSIYSPVINGKTIAIDIDLTVVDSVTGWLNWFEEKTGKKFVDSPGFIEDYAPIMTSQGLQCDACDYWRQSSLYDTMEPFEDCIDALEKMKSMGATLIFASACFPEHIKSKERFIKKYFPFSDGFIPVSTHMKRYIQHDIFIEDTPSVLIDSIADNSSRIALLHTTTRNKSVTNLPKSVRRFSWSDFI